MTTLAARLYTGLKRHPRIFAAASLLRGRQGIALDYPLNPEPRYGYRQPPHPQLAAMITAGRSNYEQLITSLSEVKPALEALPAEWWANAYLPALDAATLYYFITRHQPARYVEVGSGISTRFARRAVADRQLPTRITSIDPAPRAEIDQLCDEVIRQPVEAADLSRFRRLQNGDVLFIDNSHQAFQNSDVTVFFLDILPNLEPGVIVGIHDIFLPDDYPPSYAHNYYNEQYLLAAWLLGGGKKIDILLPNWFISQDPALRGLVKPLFTAKQFQNVDTHGNIFWFTTT